MWSLEGNKLTVQQKDNSWMRNAEYVKRLYKKSDFVLPKQESQKKLRETDSLQQETGVASGCLDEGTNLVYTQQTGMHMKIVADYAICFSAMYMP